MNLKDIMSKEVREKRSMYSLTLFIKKIKEYVKLFMVIKIRKTVSSGWEDE